ncbi:MAG: hypothetical protein CL946_11135 [Ectothiorhodospiraceae bacterium]|nr:hypothetical protein [Ectothiorhodospiraceae bacterium]
MERGSLILQSIRSAALHSIRYYNLYLPPGYKHSRERYPVLYLFRGHEREWCNPEEDPHRGNTSVIEILDELIGAGKIAPLIAVMPGLNSRDNSLPGLGVNFRQPHRAKRSRMGTGRFDDYLVNELIPAVDRRYKTAKGLRAVDGFSLGGYTSMLLAAKYPRLWVSAGAYDGTHMWKALIDPRKKDKRPNDTTWLENPMFDPAFGKPRDLRYMRKYNPTDIVANMNRRDLAALRKISFHIHSANFDGDKGNLDRARHFVEVLASRGIENSFADTPLSKTALHTWRHADLHMRKTLPLHDEAFQRRRILA